MSRENVTGPAMSLGFEVSVGALCDPVEAVGPHPPSNTAQLTASEDRQANGRLDGKEGDDMGRRKACKVVSFESIPQKTTPQRDLLPPASIALPARSRGQRLDVQIHLAGRGAALFGDVVGDSVDLFSSIQAID
jgi:hypothetical protein